MLEEAATVGAQSRYVQWVTPGLPAVIIRRSVADAILKEVLNAFNAIPRRGAETGGLLLGSRAGKHIQVEDFEPVPCEHRFGPSYLLSDVDRAALEETLGWFRADARHGLSVVGFYRSHTRPDFALHAEDGALFAGYFDDPSQVFLLIKPNRWQESVADFFFWREGELRQALHLDAFPFTQVCDVEHIPDAREPRAPEPAPAVLICDVPQEKRPSWEPAEPSVPANARESAGPPPRTLVSSAQPAARPTLQETELPAAARAQQPASSPPRAVPDLVPLQTTRASWQDTELPADNAWESENPPSLPGADRLPPLRRAAPVPEHSHRWSWGAVAALVLILTGALIYAPQKRETPRPAPPGGTQPEAAAPIAATPEPSTPEPPTITPPAADAAEALPAETVAAEPPPAAEPEKPAEAPSEPEISAHQEIDSVLNRWSGSIRRGDLRGALTCYAPRISPYFKKRNARPADVRKRLDYQRGRYGKLAIHRISDLNVKELSAKTAVATFVRHWETAGRRKFAGEELHRMTLVRTGSGWKIASEEQTRIY